MRHKLSRAITFDSTVRFFKFQIFSEIGSRYISKGVKINQIMGLLRLLVAAASKNALGAINSPSTLYTKKKKKEKKEKKKKRFAKFCSRPNFYMRFFSLPNTKKTPKTHIKVS